MTCARPWPRLPCACRQRSSAGNISWRAASRSSSEPLPVSTIAMPAVACGTKTCSSPSPSASPANRSHSRVMSATISEDPVCTWMLWVSTSEKRTFRPMAQGRNRYSVISDGLPSQIPDVDPQETSEWLESFDAVVDAAGARRARFLMLKLLERARERQVGVPALRSTDYVNTIPAEAEPWFPGDEFIERRIRAFIRWNAAIMVTRANTTTNVGGHIATYASSASLYEVGFNHFFRGKEGGESGDQVFIQGHGSPGMYARAFLEGRLGEENLDGFRQEISK